MTAPPAETAADPFCLTPDRPPTRPIRIALLGLGQVGSAVARLASRPVAGAGQFEIAGALVRHPRRHAAWPFTVTADALPVLDARPDVVVEALGGVEPARSLVLEALERGLPVVTANKSLIARCGSELVEAAARYGVPLRYEASVIAGVPLLCAFANRPFASRAVRLTGILNGTSNFILSRVARGEPFERALSDAQQRGFAERNPASDLDGTDAAEKLAILLRRFARLAVAPDDIARDGIRDLEPGDLRCAGAFGGTVRPVAFADWSAGLSAWVGPSFVPNAHALSRVDGVTNALSLESTEAQIPLLFAGPGAGPEVTAATILDDVVGTADGRIDAQIQGTRKAQTTQPAAGRRFVRFRGLAPEIGSRDISELLAAYDIWTERWHQEADGGRRWAMTHPCTDGSLEAALRAVAVAAGCEATAFRVLEACHG
jgi:homoserine dehydrogenase